MIPKDQTTLDKVAERMLEQAMKDTGARDIFHLMEIIFADPGAELFRLMEKK